MRKGHFCQINIGNECGLNCELCNETRSPIPYNFDEYFDWIKTRIFAHKPGNVLIAENRRSDPLSETRIADVVSFLAGCDSVKKVGILTNGMYAFPDIEYNPKLQIHISLDGPLATHEKNRGKDTFGKVWKFFETGVEKGFCIWVRAIATKSLFSGHLELFMGSILRHPNTTFILQELLCPGPENNNVYGNEHIDIAGLDTTTWEIYDFRKKYRNRICLDPEGEFFCSGFCASGNVCALKPTNESHMHAIWRKRCL